MVDNDPSPNDPPNYELGNLDCGFPNLKEVSLVNAVDKDSKDLKRVFDGTLFDSCSDPVSNLQGFKTNIARIDRTVNTY